MDRLGSSRSILLSVAAGLLVFTAIMHARVLMFKATLELGEGRGMWQVKSPQFVLFFPRLSFFFFNLPIIIVIWLISRLLKRLILSIVPVFQLVLESSKWIFEGAYSIILEASQIHSLPLARPENSPWTLTNSEASLWFQAYLSIDTGD